MNVYFLIWLCAPLLWFGASSFCQFSLPNLHPCIASPRVVHMVPIKYFNPSLLRSSLALLPHFVPFSPHSLSHFPLLLLSNCQAALGPAQHLRHRLLILLDHRKKHVCLWNVQASLDYDYIATECVWVCAHIPYLCVFPREVIFSSCNESRWGESVSIPPVTSPLPLLSLWLWQWGEAVLFIGSVVYGGNDLLSLSRLEADSSSSPPCFLPLLFFFFLYKSIAKYLICCHSQFLWEA